MDKMRVLKHHAFQEVTADLLNSIGTSLFQMSDGMAQAFIAGFQNTDHLIFQDLNVTPDTGLTVNLGLQGVFLYRLDQENSIVGVYKGTRADKLSPWTEEQLTFDPADPTNPRIDIIEAEIVEEDDPDYFETVQLFNNVTETSYAQNKYVRKVRNVKLYKKTGTPAASPVAPVATTGRFTLREVYIAANATSLVPANIIAQVFDPEFTNWTTNHGVIIFPAIYDMIQYVKQQLATNRTMIYSKPGNYQLYIPLFRNSITVEISAGGGAGSSGANNDSLLQNGQDGEDSYIDSIVRVKGGQGGRKLIGGDSDVGAIPDLQVVTNLNVPNKGKSVGVNAVDGGDGGGLYGGKGPNVLYLKQARNLIKQDEYHILMVMDGNVGYSRINIETGKMEKIYIQPFPIGESFKSWIVFQNKVFVFSQNKMYDATYGLLRYIADVNINDVIIDPQDSSKMLCVSDYTLFNLSQDGSVSNIVPLVNNPNNRATMIAGHPDVPNTLYISNGPLGIHGVNIFVVNRLNNDVNITPITYTSIRYLYLRSNAELMIFDQVSDSVCQLKKYNGVTGSIVNNNIAQNIATKGAIYDETLQVNLPVIVQTYLGTFVNPTSHRGYFMRISADGLTTGSYWASAPALEIPDQADAILNGGASGKYGGGGAGGYVESPARQAGAGGGAGGYAAGTFSVTPGSVLNITVGKGGRSVGGQVLSKASSRAGDGGDGFVKISW